jgi:hypothetical protein
MNFVVQLSRSFDRDGKFLKFMWSFELQYYGTFYSKHLKKEEEEMVSIF